MLPLCHLRLTTSTRRGEGPQLQRFGYEFTLKLRKAGLEDEMAEQRGLRNPTVLARLTFEKGSSSTQRVYLHRQGTGWMPGPLQAHRFITAEDEAGPSTHPKRQGGLHQAHRLTDAELKAIMAKTLQCRSCGEDRGLTDYTRRASCEQDAAAGPWSYGRRASNGGVPGAAWSFFGPGPTWTATGAGLTRPFK